MAKRKYKRLHYEDRQTMRGVLVDSRKILIHTKAHACDKHHPEGNDGLLMRPHFHSADFLFLYRFFFLLEHDISIPFFLLLNSASPDKVLLPVAIVQISVAYRVASVIKSFISVWLTSFKNSLNVINADFFMLSRLTFSSVTMSLKPIKKR